MKSKNDVFF